jgi:hypothetical protein
MKGAIGREMVNQRHHAPARDVVDPDLPAEMQTVLLLEGGLESVEVVTH